MDANADAPTTDTKAHEMRITQGGNMRNWISFALKFLEVSIFLVLSYMQR